MVLGNRPQQKNKGLCILAVHSFFYDMRERKENGRKKYEEEFFRSGLKVPDRNIDHLCGTDSSRGCCGNGKTGVAGEYDHQPDPCCPTVVSDRHAGIDRAGKTDAGGSTCEEKHNPRAVRCGADHVLCIDVLRQPGGNADHYGSRRTERFCSR